MKEWSYWVANITDAAKQTGPLPDAEPVAGALKDTTHIAIIDKDGNIFDSTPSGGWIGGAVILGAEEESCKNPRHSPRREDVQVGR